MIEAAGSAEILAYSYQNVRHHFQGDIIRRSLYTENHINISTKLCEHNSDLFVVLFKEGGKSSGIEPFHCLLLWFINSSRNLI
jgi:hypothetical protein